MYKLCIRHVPRARFLYHDHMHSQVIIHSHEPLAHVQLILNTARPQAHESTHSYDVLMARSITINQLFKSL